MSPASRGRPVIIDKHRLTIPGTDQAVTAQYVGSGDIVQIELPGAWDMSTYLPPEEERADVSPSHPVLMFETTLDSKVAAFPPKMLAMELINGPLFLTAVAYDTRILVCSLAYPASLRWRISSFERSSLGNAGRTRVTLTLDREPTDEEAAEIKERIRTRRSRSSISTED